MKKLIIAMLVLLLAGVACTKRIDLNLDDENFKRLVVEGWITDQEKAHRVRLSWTSNYFHNEPAPVASGAVVSISDGINSWPLTEQPLGSGYYYTAGNAAGTVGNDYTLDIQLDGGSWSATDHMRPVATIDSIALSFIDTGLDPGETPYYELLLWTVETPGIGDHYRWRTLVNGVSSSDTLSQANFTDDLLYDGAVINGFTVEWFDEDDLSSGDTIILEQHGITGAAYDVIIAVLTETDWRGGLFDAPPANVPSNISNGALGYFGAASVSEKSLIVP